MTYLDLIRDAEYKLEHNKITLGEYNKMIEPLRLEIPKRGKWIFNENMHDYCCSECGCLMPNVNEYYRKKIIGCPYCLADMREVQDANNS